VSNMRQIGHALELYAQDYPSPTIPNSQIVVPYPIIERSLAPYVKDKKLFHCPASPGSMRNRPSTYVWSIFTLYPETALAAPASYERAQERLKKLGPKFPLVVCQIHDELDHARKEATVDPHFTSPYTIELRLDGSVFRGRNPEWLRSNIFSGEGK
jgi:hypothetical protein